MINRFENGKTVKIIKLLKETNSRNSDYDKMEYE